MPPPVDLAADPPSEEVLPTLDARVFADWSGDMDAEDVAAILARVPEECARALTELRKSIAARDPAAARRTAHRLKGMASNLGARKLAQLARTIELGSQNVDDVAARLGDLETALAETLEAVAGLR